LYCTLPGKEKQEDALRHAKCYRKKEMPQIENVTQIIVMTPDGGRPNGVSNERETGGNEGIHKALPKSRQERENRTAARQAALFINRLRSRTFPGCFFNLHFLSPGGFVQSRVTHPVPEIDYRDAQRPEYGAPENRHAPRPFPEILYPPSAAVHKTPA
jgi:hypothetical protein